MKKKISGSISVTTVDDGENAFRLDLDNENDSMLYTESGTLVSGNVTSQARLYDGSDVVTSGVSFSKHSQSGCTATVSGTGLVTVTGMSAVSGKVIIKATYGGSDYFATLTLKKIVNGDKYDLLIEPNAIAYNSTTDTPDKTLSISVYRTSVSSGGGVTRVLSAPPSGYAVYANGTHLTTTTTGKYSYTTDISAISEVQVKIATGATATDILDAETVPVNKVANGEKGKDAVSATVSPSAISVPLNGFGKPKAQVSQTVSFTLRVGTDTVGGNYSFSYNAITNVSVTSGSGGKSATVTVGTGASEADLRGGLVFTVNGTYNGVSVSAKCTLSFVTAYQGESGHVGRWYEYAGEYGNDLASSLSNTDDHGWYAKRGSNFFMLIADSGTSVATSTIPTTATSTANWEYMGGDRKYYIGEAFFGKYAHFGSFIINEDWMISQQGVLTLMKNTEISRTSWSYAQFTAKSSGNRKVTFENHSSSSVSLTLYVNNASTTTSITIGGKSSKSITLSVEANKTYDFRRTSGVTVILSASMEPSMEYTLFDPDYPTGMGYLKFVPNFAVDGLTGKTYQRSAYIRGNIYNPLLRITSANYLEYGYVSSETYYINLLSTDYSLQIDSLPDNLKQKISLPEITDESIGVEATIFNTSGSSILFLGNSPSAIYNGGTTITGALSLLNGQFVKLKAVIIDDVYCYIIIGGGTVRRSGSGLPDHLQ